MNGFLQDLNLNVFRDPALQENLLRLIRRQAVINLQDGVRRNCKHVTSGHRTRASMSHSDENPGGATDEIKNE